MSTTGVLVVGAGAWGTALASVFARAGRETYLYDSDTATIEALARERRHPRFEPDVEIESRITPLATLDALPPLLCGVLVVPFQALRTALESLVATLPGLPAVACASKGFEIATQKMAHEIVADVLGPAIPFAQLSGPNFAGEVLSGTPAAITVGAADAAFGRALVAAMHGPAFRPYLTSDVVGVEVGGALKNVVAIAAGVADGLELGSNTRAALITRGLAEIARFGIANGGRMETFMGLSGMGDLVLTCTDDQSRNRRFGLALARLGDVGRAAEAVGALVEGVPTSEAIAAMAKKCKVEMPIAEEVARVLRGECTPEQAVQRLLAREPVVEGV